MNTRPARVVTLAMVILFVACEAMARGEVSGRLFLTYQNSKSLLTSERFTQHYEATLKDEFYYNSKLSLSLFFDDAKNLTDDLTIRRYRAHADLVHQNYSLNLRFAPRQKTTALQLQQSQELSRNQLSLDIHPRKYPRARLVYSSRDTYFNGQFTGDTRDLRADLDYQYRWLQLRLNRWDTRRNNTTSRNTSVTGGSVRGVKSYKQWFNVNASYAYQLTQQEQRLFRTDVANHTINGAITTRFKHYAGFDLTGTSRLLSTTGSVSNETHNDSYIARLLFFPRSPVKPILSRTYLLTENDDIRMLADYATGEVVATGEMFDGTVGRAHVALRQDINSEGGIVPPNLYFLGVRSRIYEGVDLRAEATVQQRQEGRVFVDRYQMSTVFELFLQLRENLMMTPSAQHIKFENQVSFLRNDRAMYGLRTNYFPSQGITMGLDVTQNRITTGLARQVTTITGVLNVRMRDRSNFNFSYALNNAGLIGEPAPGVVSAERDSRTLNFQLRVWTSQRGSIAFNYTDIHRERALGTTDVAVDYRLDF